MDESPNATLNHPLRNVTLRVSQIFSACSFCKARKIKCDGVVPSCGGCVRFGRQSTCSLVTGTAVHGRDYPTYLRMRIESTRRELRRLQNDGYRLDSLPPDPDDPEHPISTEPHPQSVINSLIADLGALPIIECPYPSSAEGPTLSSLVLATASTGELSTMLHLSPEQDPKPCLPERSTALKLARHYIQHVYPRLPFFSIQGFWTQFEHVYSGVVPPAESGGQSTPMDPASVLSPTQNDVNCSAISHDYSYFTTLLLLAISTSSLSRSLDSVINNQAQRLFRAALTFRDSAILPNTIVGVQSILFLIQFATLNPSLLNAWYLIGVGMRMCVDLGLHQDPRPLDSISPSLLETRRRLWWSMYSFDRSMSLGCSRPIEISDQAFDVSLPTFKIESSATALEVHGYLQRYRALQIQSEIYDRLDTVHDTAGLALDPVLAELGNKLADWRRANSSLPSKDLVESEWLMGRMLLVRPCRMFPERTLNDLRELCRSALGFITLYRQLAESNSIFYVQVACEKVYWTGLMLLYSHWAIHKDPESAPHSTRPLEIWMAVKDITFILGILSDRWDDGKLLRKSFDELSARVLELMEAGRDSHTTGTLPADLQRLEQYTSLTVIRASEDKGSPLGAKLAADGAELQRLVSEMM